MKQRTVAACARDARDVWELLMRTRPVAEKLNGTAILMVAMENEENPCVALEYAYQCARMFDMELMAFTGEHAVRRMIAEACLRDAVCLTALDDAPLLRKLRMAFGGAQVLDVSVKALPAAAPV